MADTHKDFFFSVVPDLKEVSANQAEGTCPLHEDKHRSFLCDLEKGTFYCSSCEKLGNAYRLASLVKGLFEEELIEEDDDQKLAKLAKLSSLDYERARKDEAKRLGVKVTTLDKLVEIKRPKDQSATSFLFPVVEPWLEKINPADLLAEITATVKRFIICDEGVAQAAALWVAMTWFIEIIHTAPMALITAPEKRCGKSQLLSLLGKLVRRPLLASNISPAATFRVIEAYAPTLLIDESDSFLRENEELRGILNSGHTRNAAHIVRCEGEKNEVRVFSTWGCKALAGIGRLADTLEDRSIIFQLRRKLPNERAESLHHADRKVFVELNSKLARFSEDFREEVRVSRPALPNTLNDRAKMNWEPLLAIADLAGGTWPNLGRKAAVELSGGKAIQSTGTELLSDIQEVFDLKGDDRISSRDMIDALCEDQERPWAAYNRGKPISPRQLCKRLAEYGIVSKNVRTLLGQSKGFERSQFSDVFSRYLTAPSDLAVPPSQTGLSSGLSDVFLGTDLESGTRPKNPSVPSKSTPDAGWDGIKVKVGGRPEQDGGGSLPWVAVGPVHLDEVIGRLRIKGGKWRPVSRSLEGRE